MIDFYNAPTPTTPEVAIDSTRGIVKLSGRSVPDNALEFYTKVIQIVSRLQPANRLIRVKFNLEYFNTSSAKCVFDLLKAFQKFQKNGYHVSIYWYYPVDDPDMMEVGEDFESLLSLDFHFREYDVSNG